MTSVYTTRADSRIKFQNLCAFWWHDIKSISVFFWRNYRDRHFLRSSGSVLSKLPWLNNSQFGSVGTLHFETRRLSAQKMLICKCVIAFGRIFLSPFFECKCNHGNRQTEENARKGGNHCDTHQLNSAPYQNKQITVLNLKTITRRKVMQNIVNSLTSFTVWSKYK